MMKLDAGYITPLPASDSGSAAVWGSKRINPRPQFCLCLTWNGYPSNEDDDDEQSLHLQLLAVVANVLEAKWVVRKELLGGNKKLKKLSVQRKLHLELGQQTSHLSNFDCGIPQHVRLPPFLSNSLKKSHEKNSDKTWIQTIDRQTKYFRKPYVVCAANEHQSPSSSRILMVCF